MKIKITKLIITTLLLTKFCNAQQTVTDRLVVPNLCNETFSSYVGPGTNNPAAVTYPNAYNTPPSPGYNVNSVAFFGDDLYVGTLFGSGILIYPNYANANTTYNTAPTLIPIPASLSGSDVVGMKFDASGNLYASVSNFNFSATAPSSIIKFNAPFYNTSSVVYSDLTAYFGNIELDGNFILFTDYLNDQLVIVDLTNLSNVSKVNSQTTNAFNVSVANTNSSLNTSEPYVLKGPEGMAFDASGNLWVANNNDGNVNSFGTLVKLSNSLISIFETTPGTYSFDDIGINSANQIAGYYIYNIPAPSAAQVTCLSASGSQAQLGSITFNAARDTLYVNEEVGGGTLKLATATLSNIGTNLNNYKLSTSNSNPGNGQTAIVPVNGSLSINYISLTAQKAKEDVILKWTIANTSNLKNFDIEKSTNGFDFNKIATISNNTNQNYNYVDNIIDNNLLYYKIKAIDNNGKIYYSNIEKVRTDIDEIITLFPNPVSDICNIYSNTSTNKKYKISDITGKIFIQGIFTNNLKLNFNGLTNGIYYLTTINNYGKSISQKIIKN